MKQAAFWLAMFLLALPCGPSVAEAAKSTQGKTSGPIEISVDLTDVSRKILHAHLVFPVKPGPMTLYYPKYIPGEHGPTGPVVNLAGLVFRVNGKKLAWKRDPKDMYAFHLTIPEGASQLEVSLDYLSPTGGGRFTAGVSVTPKLAILNWNQVSLYPAGVPTAKLTYEASVTLPEDWRFASALEVAGKDGNNFHFKAAPYNVLVDSPVMAGQYFKQIKLSPKSKKQRYLAMVADYPRALDLSEEQESNFRNLVRQTQSLFHSVHYDDYHFLFTLSSRTAHFGLEHHQSSDDRYRSDFFSNEKSYLVGSSLLAREYVHSWNGKFRRPEKLYQSNYQKPEQTRMLWAYEGLSNYWGLVLTARSGFRSASETRAALALAAANMSHRPGRSWRPLVDTAAAAQLLFGAPKGWANWRRGADFYAEGQLIWLDVDTKMRSLSNGKHTLDDFAQLFFGMHDGSQHVSTYSFDDLVNALNKVEAYDWRSFLRSRVARPEGHAPLAGIKRAGWKLVYTDHRSKYQKARESLYKYRNLMFGIGLKLSKQGQLYDVRWNGPAFKAGVGPGMKIKAVNGRSFSSETLARAISKAKDSEEPIKLLINNQGYLRTYSVNYHQGLKYPHLERLEDKPNRLKAILTPVEMAR